MAEVVLKKKQVEVLKVTIGDKTYTLPLGASVPYRTLKKIGTEEGLIEFLEDHIPNDVVDLLTADELRQIVEAWSNATKEQSGITPGES